MKRVLVLAIAPLMVSAFTGAALAGGTKMSADADTRLQGSADAGASGAQADVGTNTELDTESTASTDEEARFGSVISAMQASDSAASDVRSITDASQIEIVRVSEIAEGDSMSTLDEALSRHQAKVDELRRAIEANTALSERLRQEQVQPDDVVAAETTDDDSLRVFVR